MCRYFRINHGTFYANMLRKVKTDPKAKESFDPHDSLALGSEQRWEAAFLIY